MGRIQNARRNILPLSSAPCVLNVSLEPTIYDLIYAHTLMNVPSSAVFAVKHLLVNMTGNDTKAFILAKRSLYAVVCLRTTTTGAVGDDLPAPMP